MRSPSPVRARPGVHLAALVGLACAPIWAVAYFVPQDGPAHSYSAYLMLELLRDSPAVASHFAWNSWTLPNSSGHWLLMLLQSFSSPMVATKILATLTFSGLVAATGFLRWATAGRDGLLTSLWIGAAIGFNWLWLCGLYNFLLGVIGFAVTIGFYFHGSDSSERWRAPRVAGFALLFLLVYFSHLVAFAVLAASLLLLAASEPAPRRGRICLAIVLALLPAVILALVHGAAATGEAYFPVWRRLTEPASIASWFFQLRTADPFVLISRRAFPFSSAHSRLFALFTPLLWLLVALGGLAWQTFAVRSRAAPLATPRRYRALMAICAGCALVAIFGPDDFGESHGTLLRERFALLAAVAFVPLFRTGGAEDVHGPLRLRFAHLALAGVVLFQTAVLWEYARRTTRDAAEFLPVASALLGRESLASVVVLEDGKRFHSNPVAQMSNFLGIGRRTRIWDNYEIGYELFPLVARSAAEQRFVRAFTSVNVFDLTDPVSVVEARLAGLERCLKEDGGRIQTLLLWGREARVEALLSSWFEDEPFFEKGRARFYRRRAAPASASTVSPLAQP
ncbi:MAG: hypothetical protein ABIV06_10670 [Thermoanaerobaculia bacterium]